MIRDYSNSQIVTALKYIPEVTEFWEYKATFPKYSVLYLAIFYLSEKGGQLADDHNASLLCSHKSIQHGIICATSKEGRGQSSEGCV